MHELVWTGRFDTEVQRIYERCEDSRAGGGDRFYGDLLAHLRQLENHPQSGSRLKGTSLRHLLVINKRYGVIHRVEPRGVILHTIFDQRRDPAELARIIREITREIDNPKPDES